MTWPNQGGEGGASAFTDLTDVPGTIVPSGYSVGNAAGTALAFAAASQIVDWVDVSNSSPSSGFVDVTGGAYAIESFGNVVEGAEIFIAYPTSELDCGLWVLGDLSTLTAVPVTRSPRTPLGSIWYAGSVFCARMGVGGSGFLMPYQIRVLTDELPTTQGALGATDVFIDCSVFGENTLANLLIDPAAAVTLLGYVETGGNSYPAKVPQSSLFTLLTENNFMVVAPPPPTGTHVLKSVENVVQWVEEV